MQQVFVGLMRAQRMYTSRRLARINRLDGKDRARRLCGLMFYAYVLAINAELRGRKEAAARFAQRAARYERLEADEVVRAQQERLKEFLDTRWHAQV